MLEMIIGIGLVLVVVIGTEKISRKRIVDDELTRKIPHMTVSVVIALLPFFVDLKLVSVGAIAYLLIAWLIFKFDLFAKARHVSRKTYGEIFFPLGVLATSLIAPNKWIFAASILTLGIADSMAALVGRKKGNHTFLVVGQKKSFEGSLAFIAISSIITAWVVYVAPANIMQSWQILICLPLLSGIVEAYSPFGTDNFFVPVLVAVVLNSLVVVS